MFNYPIHFFAPPASDAALPGRFAVVLLLLPVVLIVLRRRPDLLLPTLARMVLPGLDRGAGPGPRHDPLNLVPLRARRSADGVPAVRSAAAGSTRTQALAAARAPAGFVLYCVISLPWAYAERKGGWRVFGQEVSSRVRSGDLVLFHSRRAWEWYNPILYVHMQHYAPQPLRCPIALLTEPPSRDVIVRAAAACVAPVRARHRGARSPGIHRNRTLLRVSHRVDRPAGPRKTAAIDRITSPRPSCDPCLIPPSPESPPRPPPPAADPCCRHRSKEETARSA